MHMPMATNINSPNKCTCMYTAIWGPTGEFNFHQYSAFLATQ